MSVDKLLLFLLGISTTTRSQASLSAFQVQFFLQVAWSEFIDGYNPVTIFNIDRAVAAVCPQIWNNWLSVGPMFYWVLVMCATLSTISFLQAVARQFLSWIHCKFCGGNDAAYNLVCLLLFFKVQFTLAAHMLCIGCLFTGHWTTTSSAALFPNPLGTLHRCNT